MSASGLPAVQRAHASTGIQFHEPRLPRWRGQGRKCGYSARLAASSSHVVQPQISGEGGIKGHSRTASVLPPPPGQHVDAEKVANHRNAQTYQERQCKKTEDDEAKHEEEPHKLSHFPSPSVAVLQRVQVDHAQAGVQTAEF